MKILIDINHPAHVHLFRVFAKIMIQKGHKIIFTARKKEITHILLNNYGLKYISLGTHYKSTAGKLYGTIKYNFILYKVVKKYQPDIFLSHLSLNLILSKIIFKKPHIALTDSEHISILQKVMKPFLEVFLTPSCFRNDLGKKQISYNGYHELAYLHPNYFTADESVIKDLGIKKNEKIFIIRKTTGAAFENIGQQLMEQEELMKLVHFLEKKGRVLISGEGEIDFRLEKYLFHLKPERIHSLLYFAHMFIGDSLTMFTEAAILGTPSIIISTEGFLLGNFDDICDNYKLGFRYKTFSEAFNKIKDLLDKKHLKQEWMEKREKLLIDKIDVTSYLVDFIENYKEKIKM